MVAAVPSTSKIPQRVAFWTLFCFLLAVVGALAVTLVSVSFSVQILAAAVVAPIVALTVALLYFEHQNRRWSYAATSILGIAGVTLRLLVNSRPSLEVGGGLPVSVTVAYVSLGLAVVGTNLWSYLRSLTGR